ncbi:MAG: hypothetical protein IPP60_15325 [Sphingobacteriales bacterium]|nr:hypothetical protein [Sphingobacteriales bacterium]
MRPKIIMSRQSSEPLILLDSGVVRHFINGNRILELQQVFPGWFVMLDKVKNELCRSKSIENIVINLIRMTGMQLMQFPTEMEIIREYAVLKDNLVMVRVHAWLLQNIKTLHCKQ